MQSYVHVHPGYREKLADLRETVKLQVHFYNRISRSERPRSENWHAHSFLCTHSMATNIFISQGKFMRGLGTCVFFASVVSARHDFKYFACFLTGFSHAV